MLLLGLDGPVNLLNPKPVIIPIKGREFINHGSG